MMKIIRRILSIVMLIASVWILAWALIPARRQTLVQPIAPVTVSEIDGGIKTVLVISDYRVVLEWPETLRIGESGLMTLTFEPAPIRENSQALPATAVSVYTSNNLMAESSFEVAGLQVNPAVPRRESLPEGKSVKQKWQLSTLQSGDYRGSLWLSLRILPLSGGTPSNMPVFIHEVDLHATSLLGVSGLLARVAGSIGLILGLALSYDVMIAFIKKIR